MLRILTPKVQGIRHRVDWETAESDTGHLFRSQYVSAEMPPLMFAGIVHRGTYDFRGRAFFFGSNDDTASTVGGLGDALFNGVRSDGATTISRFR
jgi:hypothetical protein